MSLQEVMKAVEQLSAEEQAELRAFLDRLTPAHMAPVEERIRKMDEAASIIREGFSDEEWARIEQDMNEEYVEADDESLWQA
jgi:hypothetical protein